MNSHSLVAFDAQSGDRKWSSEPPHYFDHATAGAVLVNDTAVVADKNRVAFRADGTAVWEHESESSFSPYAAVDESLVVGGGNAAPRALMGIDAATGRVLWETTPENWINTNAHYAASDAVRVGSQIVAVDFDGPLAGLTMEGTVTWTRSNEWDTHGPGRPTLASGDDMAVAASGAVAGIAPATGELHWQRTLPDYATGVAVANGTAYVTVGSETPKVDSWDASGGVLSYDLEDGTEHWRVQTPTQPTPPAVAGSEVRIGTAEGVLIGIDAESGEQRWQRSVGSRVTTAPLVGPSHTFIGVHAPDGTGAVAAVSR